RPWRTTARHSASPSGARTLATGDMAESLSGRASDKSDISSLFARYKRIPTRIKRNEMSILSEGLVRKARPPLPGQPAGPNRGRDCFRRGKAKRDETKHRPPLAAFQD